MDFQIEQYNNKKEELKINDPVEYEKFIQEHEGHHKVYDNGYIDVSTMIEELNIDYVLMAYLYCGVDILKYNIPYAFNSDYIISILCIEFREFVSYPKNTIKKCQNCGKYFIPENLKTTKYCNNNFEDGKTCREIGKEKSYKNNLKKDKLLEIYRKRYMSLASSNSHYHTEKTEQKFEKYKLEGITMKEKYLKGELSENEFKKWIESSYQA